MTPSGYSVQPPGRSRMLVLDKAIADQRAVQMSAIVTPLYSIEQVIAAMGTIALCEDAIDHLRDLEAK